MKHIIAIIALALVSLTLSAKELAKNDITGYSLIETAGIYSIKGSTGVIPLGTIDQAKSFFSNANKAIVKETLNDIFDCGKDQFEVGKDDQGYYIIKVGLGALKLRYSDTVVFGTALGLKNLEKPAKKFYSKVQDGVGKLIDKM